MPRATKGLKSLSPMQQKIFAVFPQLVIDAESKAVTPTEIVEFAKSLDDSLFPQGMPKQAAAAALMTGIYRSVKGLHRVKANSGHGYKYFYNLEVEMPKNAPRRVPHRKVKAAKPIGQVARESIATAQRQQRVAIEAAKPKYQTVARVDGSIAGVVHNGVLYETLDSFVNALNA